MIVHIFPYIAVINPKSTTMKFKFNDGQEFHVRKIPRCNMIEIKIGNEKMCYERSEEELQKIAAETEGRRSTIIEKIHQYFMPQERHNRHRQKTFKV